MQDIIVKLVMLTAAGLSASLMSCSGAEPAGAIEKAAFGVLPGGQSVEIYTLRNAQGMEARIMTYGGILVSLKTPDKNGKLGDVVLGFDDLDGYVKGTHFFGALIGRCGNRIAKGKFTLEGKGYTLATNNGPNHLHGGIKGFDKVVWTATSRLTAYGPTLELTYTAKDGEEGYPGNLSATATYTLTEKNELKLDFTATTDKATPCNLTQHSYFNLRGSGDILGDVMEINAKKFTPMDETSIPTGELRPVENTPFDFRKPTPIGAHIEEPYEQLKFGGGYDHNFVLDKTEHHLGLAARAFDPVSGRQLEVYTTAPGVQFYTGNFLDGTTTGKGGWAYGKRTGFCLEPQNFPDSINHPSFPSVVLKPGQTYKHSIVYHFSIKK